MLKGRVQIKDGFWYTVINHKDNDGKYKRKWQTTNLKERGNKKEALKILQQRLQEFEEKQRVKNDQSVRRVKPKNQPLGTADTPFVDYCKAYMDSEKKELSPFVYHNYSTKYIKIFKEYFRDKTVMDITYEEIEGFYTYMKQVRGAKNTTIIGYTDVLRPALRRAYKDKIIPDNPFDSVEPLVKEKPMVRYYNKDELDRFFEVIKGHRFELAYTMLAYYGLRRSELVGLRWNSIDFEHDMIMINHKVLKIDKTLIGFNQLKTRSSYRTLPLLPNIKKELLGLRQSIEENRRFYGNTYDTKWLDYVFVYEQGGLICPDNLTATFAKLLKKNNLKKIRLHDLRHSCASLLLASGEVNIKQIQDWLGHADYSTTANIYSHLDYGSKKQAADVLIKTFEEKQNDLSILSEDELEIVKNKIIAQMRSLGIDNIDEYADYLKAQKNNEKEQKSGKNDMEM